MGFFPHRLSFDENLVGFVPTSTAKLRAATFLDDRGDFVTGPIRLEAMDEVLAANAADAEPCRLIFHTSFCGSTLLGRLLDRPGKSLVLREPQSLSDLAARQAMLDQSGARDPRVERMLAVLPGLLMRSAAAGEPVTIKPSNWINNLAPALCGMLPVRPVFLSMQPRAFLLAVFRGGQDRIAFTARAAVHFSQAGRRNADRVAAALGQSDDQAVQLARLAALAHRMQLELFAEARLTGGWGEEHAIDFAELAVRPVETADRAARLLGLDLSVAEIEENAARWLSRDAKQPDAAFSTEAQAAHGREVEDRFGPAIDDALAWVDSA